MATSIEGRELDVATLLGDDYLFIVPPYQRAYAWGLEQTEELLDDLITAHSEGEDQPYFLGSIVTAKNQGQQRSEVIDGQQRLTTLTILMACLAERLEDENNRQAVLTRIRQAGASVLGQADVHRLQIRKRDNDFLQQYVQNPAALDQLESLDPAQLETDAQRNIRANAIRVRAELGDMGQSTLAAFAKFVLRECILVLVSTQDVETAFRVFSVLNDRGLDLSPADIIKAEIIGPMPDDDSETYTTIWEDAEDELGTEAFGDLFSHIRTIYVKKKQRGTLVREFKDHVIDPAPSMTGLIDDVIAPLADIYAAVRTWSWKATEHESEINRHLRWFSGFDNFDWIPPVLLHMHHHKGDGEAIARFLRSMDRLASSLFIRRVPVTKRIERWSTVLQAIESGDQDELDVTISLSTDEVQATCDQLAGELYRVSRVPKYVLLRLDEDLTDTGATYDHGIIQVEHVLPQNPSTDSVWFSEFTGEDREYWTHRLANLVLLPRRKNAKARNYDFDKKKSVYFRDSEGKQPFTITNEVIETDKWSTDVLEQRQQRLLGRLFNLWKLGEGSNDDG